MTLFHFQFQSATYSYHMNGGLTVSHSLSLPSLPPPPSLGVLMSTSELSGKHDKMLGRGEGSQYWINIPSREGLKYS